MLSGQQLLPDLLWNHPTQVGVIVLVGSIQNIKCFSPCEKHFLLV